MVDQYLVEMDYKIYCAYEDLLSELSEISTGYRIALNEAQVEMLNELALTSVSTYINKVIAAIQDTWNKFKSGAKQSMWSSYYKANEDTLTSSSFNMLVEKGTRVPSISDIRTCINKPIPEYKKELTLKSEEDFLQSDSDLRYFYEKDKSIRDVAEAKCFKEMENEFTIHGSEGLKVYMNLMNDYEKIADGISSDIRKINNASKEIQRKAAEAQKKVEEEKKKKEEAEKKAKEEEAKAKAAPDPNSSNQSEAKPKTDSSGAAQVNTNVSDSALIPNVAQFFLEAFTTEGFSNADADKDESSSSSDSSDEKTPEGLMTQEELDGVSVYWKTCTAILSTKMKILNSGRKESFKFIKNFVHLANKEDRAIKKEKRKAEKAAKNGEVTI